MSRLLGQGMSEDARRRDIEQSDCEYIQEQRKARKAANIIHIKCVFEDTFSFAKTTRIVTRSEATFEKMKNDIGKVVHSEFKHHIRWNWRLISCEQAKPEDYSNLTEEERQAWENDTRKRSLNQAL